MSCELSMPGKIDWLICKSTNLNGSGPSIVDSVSCKNNNKVTAVGFPSGSETRSTLEKKIRYTERPKSYLLIETGSGSTTPRRNGA